MKYKHLQNSLTKIHVMREEHNGLEKLLLLLTLLRMCFNVCQWCPILVEYSTGYYIDVSHLLVVMNITSLLDFSSRCQTDPFDSSVSLHRWYYYLSLRYMIIYLPRSRRNLIHLQLNTHQEHPPCFPKVHVYSSLLLTTRSKEDL